MTHDLSLPLLHALLGAKSGAFCSGFSGLSKKRLCKVRQSVCFRRVRAACSLRRNRPNFLGSIICYACFMLGFILYHVKSKIACRPAEQTAQADSELEMNLCSANVNLQAGFANRGIDKQNHRDTGLANLVPRVGALYMTRFCRPWPRPLPAYRDDDSGLGEQALLDSATTRS